MAYDCEECGMEIVCYCNATEHPPCGECEGHIDRCGEDDEDEEPEDDFVDENDVLALMRKRST